MDLENLFIKLKAMDDDVITKSVAFSLVKKADNNENENLFYKYRIEADVQKDLYNLVKNYFNDKRVRNRNQNKYDAVIQRRDNKGFYLVNECDYNHVKKFFNALKNTKTIGSSKNIKIEKFIAYIITIEYETDKFIYYLGEISALNSLNKTKFVGNITDDKLKRVDENNLVGFNEKMAMFVCDEEMIINQISIFEKLCNMHIEFDEQASQLLETISEYDLITNFNEFEKRIQKDSKFSRRLAKLNEQPERVVAFFKNINNVNQVLESTEFREKFDGIELVDGKLVYKENLTQQFISLISDSAYESIVGKQKRLDENI
ncbi:Kiwa anti-phage protein KwaB-like domain-containing protein [Staphylococcus xylosus]|uniref:Kiwa anti-phage protein KwaB-like domain-containing protein n=1 Tax=Staphylococcus xylosus TaxID=1288 RepID=UPI003F5710F4